MTTQCLKAGLWLSLIPKGPCVAEVPQAGFSVVGKNATLCLPAGVPLVSMVPKIHGYLQQPLLVSCSVYSTLPFRLQLQRDGERLGEERYFQ